jgi:hypothetical protein
MKFSYNNNLRIKSSMIRQYLSTFILFCAVEADRQAPENPTMKGRQNARLL